MANRDLKEKRKQMLLSVTAFSPRDSLSKLGSPHGLANDLLDDMGFQYNKVKWPKIEQMLPKLMKLVEGEVKSFPQGETDEHRRL